jgi:trimeric autotransporter adhesin
MNAIAPKLKFSVLALVTALAACGGGGGGSTPTVPATTNVSTTVVDGAILNALVCLDKNRNALCDADETQGRTDATGNVTLAVPNADVGLYPVIALVGTDAVDADHGPITVPYALSAPADQTGVVSPLTTLVQQTVATTGASTAQAAKTVQDATGITASLFQDFTKVAAPTDGSISAATVARLMVVTTQRQQSAIASAVGQLALDGSTISQADLDKAIQKKLLELLPALVSALSDPAVLAAATPTAKEAALLGAATALITSDGLTPASAGTVVAINNQATTAVPTTAPVAQIQLANLGFTDVSNYFVRLFTASLAQNTPDSGNNIKYVDRRLRSAAGTVAKWGAGSEPARGADLHWNGNAWVSCPINYENSAGVRDAQGNTVYNYCDNLETGKSSRATFDVSGRAMAEVYAEIRAANYTNLTLADVAALGTAVFPDGSALFYQTNTPLTTAIGYYPAGVNSPAGTSNIVTQYSAAVAAGGDANVQAAGTGCNVVTVGANGAPTTTLERNTNGTNSSTLEGMIAAKVGTPCVFSPTSSFTYLGTVYTSPEPNAGWGSATVSLGKIGTAPVNSGAAPGFYTGNTLLRAAFTGGSAVSYLSCKERFDNGGARACSLAGTGTYTIATLGDARVLTFSDLPVQTAPLNYNRVFVERGGMVYFGYRSKPLMTNVARLNNAAATALLAQLGVPAENPSVPLALSAASYQGTWDLRTATSSVSPTNGTTLFISSTGSVSCLNKANSTLFACSAAITDPVSGAFTFSDGVGASAIGNLAFQAGTGSGTYNDPTLNPTTGALLAGRR